MLAIIIILCVLICLSLVFLVNIPIINKHRESTVNVINYDLFMRKFIYKVPLHRDEITRLLLTKNITENLSCTYDSAESTLKFSATSELQTYYIQIEEHDGYCVLKLENTAKIPMRSSIPLKINPFIIDKLQAEPIPYSMFPF